MAQDLVSGTPNLLVANMYWMVAFKIRVIWCIIIWRNAKWKIQRFVKVFAILSRLSKSASFHLNDLDSEVGNELQFWCHPHKSVSRLRVSWKLCRNLCSRSLLRSKLNPVINLIPLGLWQLKLEFVDGLMNFKMLFSKAEKVTKFLIFNSKLFHSMSVDEKKIMFTTEEGNLIISSCIIGFAIVLGSVLKRY